VKGDLNHRREIFLFHRKKPFRQRFLLHLCAFCGEI
jgi:hypothetical protein